MCARKHHYPSNASTENYSMNYDLTTILLSDGIELCKLSREIMLDEALCHAEHSRQHMQRKPLLGSTLLGRTNLNQFLLICSAV